MLVCNFYGAPCAGKSTTRSDVFRRLKIAGVAVEEVPEVTKGLVWQNRTTALRCQPYIFGEQLHAIETLRGQVDVALCDGPLLLCRYYSIRHQSGYPDSFHDAIAQIDAAMDTMNFFLWPHHGYEEMGRLQTADQAREIGDGLRHMLDDVGVRVHDLDVNPDIGETIAGLIMARIAGSGLSNR